MSEPTAAVILFAEALYDLIVSQSESGEPCYTTDQISRWWPGRCSTLATKARKVLINDGRIVMHRVKVCTAYEVTATGKTTGLSDPGTVVGTAAKTAAPFSTILYEHYRQCTAEDKPLPIGNSIMAWASREHGVKKTAVNAARRHLVDAQQIVIETEYCRTRVHIVETGAVSRWSNGDPSVHQDRMISPAPPPVGTCWSIRCSERAVPVGSFCSLHAPPHWRMREEAAS